VHTRQMHALGRIAACAILQPLRHALSAVVGVTVGCVGVTVRVTRRWARPLYTEPFHRDCAVRVTHDIRYALRVTCSGPHSRRLPVAGHCHSHCTVTGILLILRFTVSRESCAICTGGHERFLAAASVPTQSTAPGPLPARSCDGPLGSPGAASRAPTRDSQFPLARCACSLSFCTVTQAPSYLKGHIVNAINLAARPKRAEPSLCTRGGDYRKHSSSTVRLGVCTRHGCERRTRS
jgi:hypothetical protein